MKKSKTEIEQMVTAFEKNYMTIFQESPEEEMMKHLFTSLLVKKTEQLFNSQWADNNIETIKDGYDAWRQRQAGTTQQNSADVVRKDAPKAQKKKRRTNSSRKKANP